MKPPKLTILLASPRGFCAGVDRAIQIVEESLKKYGTPVYVRHEIVHNKYVVKQLERKGAVFVEDLDEVPENVPVIFSAHGVPKSVPIEAERRNLTYFDATCPLVSKVHLGAERNYNDGRHVILIGHAGHPEVIGTMGQLADGAITLVESVKDALRLSIPANTPLSFITQTTLSVDDTSEIITVLRARFPHIKGPAKKDICYATTNRQDAVKTIAERCDGLIVIGAPNSSNSQRLVEVAKNKGCIESLLIQRVNDIDWKWIGNKNTLGITAGASAPELLVEEVIREFRKRFTITIEEVTIAKEELKFKLPQVLMA